MANLRASTMLCFNTQPPNGGWRRCIARECIVGCFNTQPPKGGWFLRKVLIMLRIVSTHSRLKAAGEIQQVLLSVAVVSTHSRLKAAGRRGACVIADGLVSTHSRLKAAAWQLSMMTVRCMFQHTAA